jgi:uncharacterized protein (DUF1778 family)
MANTALAKGRLDVRIAEEDKSLIEHAAAICGKSISEFVIPMAVNRAKQVVRKHHTTVLSERDFRSFLEMLEAAPKPNAALRKAMAKFDRIYRQP